MRLNSFVIVAAAVLAALISVQTVRATSLYYDSFDYAAQIPGTVAQTSSGNTLGVNWPSIDGKPAGSAIAPWLIYLRGNSSPYVGSGSLSYPGLAVDPSPSSNNAMFRGDSGSGDNYHW